VARRLKKSVDKTEETDEFLGFFGRAREVFVEKRKPIVGGLIVVGLVVLAVVVWTRNLEQRERRGSFVLYQGMTALKDADLLKGEEASEAYEKALNILRNLVDEYGSTKSGQLGRLFLGKCLARLNRHGEAIQQYEVFLSRNENHPLYAALATQSLGFAYENQKDYEKALACFKEVADMRGSFLTEASTLAVGRIYEAMGQKREALEAYQKYLTNHPNSAVSNRIRGRVVQLENQIQ
jgi:tetratricopeptide (TPR) repeat protein